MDDSKKHVCEAKRIVAHLSRLWIVITLAAAAPALAHEEIVTNLRVVSGSVFEAGVNRYELAGIDAPDLLQGCRDNAQTFYRCGYNSWQFLHRLVEGRDLECRSFGEVRPGTVRAQCTLDGRDLAELVVRQGHAVAVTGSIDYSAAEAEARENRRGLWSGNFVPPSQWRERMKTPAFVPAADR